MSSDINDPGYILDTKWQLSTKYALQQTINMNNINIMEYADIWICVISKCHVKRPQQQLDDKINSIFNTYYIIFLILNPNR